MRAAFDVIYTFFKRPQPSHGMRDWVLAKPFAGPQIDFRGYGAGTYNGTPRIATTPVPLVTQQMGVVNDLRGYGASAQAASIMAQPLVVKPNYSDL